MKRADRWVLVALAVFCLAGLGGCGPLPGSSDSAAQTSAVPTPTPVSTPKPEHVLPPGFSERMRFEADTDGDGQLDIIVLALTADDEAQIGLLKTDGYDYIAAGEGTFTDAHIAATPNGAPCVLVTSDLGSDDYVTRVVAFSANTPELKGEAIAYVEEAEGAHVVLASVTEAIGSWFYTREYMLSESFALEPVSEMRIDAQAAEPLHTIRTLPVEVLLDGEYAADTLPADMLLYPTATDGKTYLSFTLEDGTEGRVLFTRGEDYMTQINGLPEEDYFDNLDYWD